MATTSLFYGTFTGQERNRIDWHLRRLRKLLPVRVCWVGCGATLGYEIEDLDEYCEASGREQGEVVGELRGTIGERVWPRL